MESVLEKDIQVHKLEEYFQHVMFCIPGNKIESRSTSNPAAMLKS